MEKVKTAIIKVDQNEYRELKVYCAKNDLTINAYFNNCLKETLKKEKEKENKEK